jgi:hypothetical protein
VLLAAALPAQPVHGFPRAAAGTGFAESFERVLEAGGLAGERPREAAGAPGDGEELRGPAQTKPHRFWIGVASGLAIGGSAWNSFRDGANQRFHFVSEGWFGRHTYAGGADKVSHVVSYYIVAKLLAGVDAELGLPSDEAILLGAGVSAAAGFVTELGDGRGRYGFSYEDILMDWLGAAAAIWIARYGLDDLVGFRAGLVSAPDAVCCPYGGTGKDYTEEIYTTDLKIAGVGRRAKVDVGPARFLLLSVSYSAKGYPYADPRVRERQVGLELGLNFGEVLRAVGVPPDAWWSKILYFAFDVLRLPYTQIGMYYDLNSGRWRGPGIGNAWPGGRR